MYQYKDHLEGGASRKGAVHLFSVRARWRARERLSYKDTNGDGVITAASEILEEIDEGDWPIGTSTSRFTEHLIK